MRTILSDPRLRLFYLGGAAALFGDNVLWLAMSVWVKLLTGSTSLAGIAALMLVLGNLLSPLTGMLVDRVRRRPLMIWTLLATALLLLTLLTVDDRGDVWLVYLVTFLYGVSGSVTATASAVLRPLLVAEERLADANGLLQAINQALRIITPLVGVGLLGWFGARTVVIADAVLFVLAAACFAVLRLDEERPTPEPVQWFRQMSAGLSFIAGQPVLRRLALAFTLTMLGVGVFETVGLQIVTIGLGHAPTWIGVLAAVQGGSGVVGGLTAARASRHLGDRALIATGLIIMAACTAVMAVPVDAVVIAATALLGVGVPWAIVAYITVFQKTSPVRLLGRVMGAQGLTFQVPQSVGIAAGAALVASVDYRSLCYAIAAATGLAALIVGLGHRRPSAPQEPAEADDPLPAVV